MEAVVPYNFLQYIHCIKAGIVHVSCSFYWYRRISRSKKREVMKKKTYDGREVTFITENTQTDWDWLEEAEKSGKAHLLRPRDSKFYSLMALELKVKAFNPET